MQLEAKSFLANRQAGQWPEPQPEVALNASHGAHNEGATRGEGGTGRPSGQRIDLSCKEPQLEMSFPSYPCDL